MVNKFFPFAIQAITLSRINKKSNFFYSLFCLIFISIKKNPLLLVDFVLLYVIVYYILKNYTFTFIFEKKSPKNMFD